MELDRERRRIRLGMKQLEPTTVDHYISDHRLGETVSGRVVEVRGSEAKVELGEGVIATCQLKDRGETQAGEAQTKPTDVSSLGAMLAARWKQGGPTEPSKEVARAGQVRTFRIRGMDAGKRLIELELAG